MDVPEYAYSFKYLIDKYYENPVRNFFLGYQAKLESAHHKNISLLTLLSLAVDEEFKTGLFMSLRGMTWTSKVSLDEIVFDYLEDGIFREHLGLCSVTSSFGVMIRVEATLYEPSFELDHIADHFLHAISYDQKAKYSDGEDVERDMYVFDRKHKIKNEPCDTICIELPIGSYVDVILNCDPEDTGNQHIILHITRVE